MLIGDVISSLVVVAAGALIFWLAWIGVAPRSRPAIFSRQRKLGRPVMLGWAIVIIFIGLWFVGRSFGVL